jgi:hypothetical protein
METYMADLKVEVANFTGIGAQRSTYGVTGKGSWSLNHIPWRLAQFDVDLYQRPVFLGERLVPLLGQQVHTTDIFVRNVDPSELEKAKRVVNDLCWLLSLARLSQVTPFSYRYQNSVRVNRSDRIMMDFRAPISHFEGAGTQTFVAETWSAYRTLKTRRDLQEFIDYLTIAERPDQPIEVRALLVSVVIEGLKATYARSKGIPYVNNFFRTKKRTKKTNELIAYSFADLVKEMLAEVGMPPMQKRLVAMRNEIVHFGLSDLDVKTLANRYAMGMSLVTRYMFRLMGYNGAMHDYQANRIRLKP